MLVISRKVGERVRGPDVWVTIVLVDRGKVRIGFEAPKDVQIVREELIQNPAQPPKPSSDGDFSDGIT